MTKEEMRTLASKAREGNALALREFKALAKAEGYVGGAGGWIRYRERPAAIVQGWAGLADHVYFGMIVFTLAEVKDAQAKRAAEVDAPIRVGDEVVRAGEPNGPRGVVRHVVEDPTHSFASVSFSGLTALWVPINGLRHVR